MSTRAVRKESNGAASPNSKIKHPLRIIPLHPYVRDVAAPAPRLTHRNGPFLTSGEVFTIFWGTSVA